jgi:hypothetical protein
LGEGGVAEEFDGGVQSEVPETDGFVVAGGEEGMLVKWRDGEDGLLVDWVGCGVPFFEDLWIEV